jgi:hypothetical protein
VILLSLQLLLDGDHGVHWAIGELRPAFFTIFYLINIMRNQVQCCVLVGEKQSCDNVFDLQHIALLLLNQLVDSFQLDLLRESKKNFPRNIAEGKPKMLMPMASSENMGT